MLCKVIVLCFSLVQVIGFTASDSYNISDYQDVLPTCGKNEEMTYDRKICPPKSCDSLFTSYSCLDGPPEPGCDCIDGFLRNDNGDCIPKEQCPKSNLPKCGPNEKATFDRIVCPPQTCESTYTIYTCEERYPEPGCDCIENYLRNSSGICIPSDQCPPPPILPVCGYNEVSTTDRAICPPQVCESRYTEYTCEFRPSEPGCDCIENHLRNASGICIPSHECPPLYIPVKPICGPNEELSDIKITCPPQTCEAKNMIYSCLPTYPEPGCNCVEGYLRNSSGVCIPSAECPSPVYNITCGQFEIKKEERTQCPPQTCESMYSINFCMPGLPEPGCDCIEGFLRDEDGVCIPSEECPIPPGFADFDDYDYDYTDSSSNDSQKTDSRSSSEMKQPKSHLYSSDNALSLPVKDNMYEVTTSKNYSTSKSISYTKIPTTSDIDFEYDY